MTTDQRLYALNALQVVGDWSVHGDGDGRLFYYDRRKDVSQWTAPDALAPLETAFMMKFMLQEAVARSGVWTAHDAGNGTLYYFNASTKVSSWERPSEWGETGADEAEETRGGGRRSRERTAREEREKLKEERREKKKRKERERHHKDKEMLAEEKDEQTEKGAAEEEREEKEPLTAEEVQAAQEREVRDKRRVEQFRTMLREKNIMPLCKWSVALPQIAGDPRFVGVPTMDERRAIFEHFVEHRREDLKAEKKGELKRARQLFSQFLREQFELDSWALGTTLSVFLSTLEDKIEPARYKDVQDNALALLTLSTQEKIYAKAVAAFKSDALKRDGEQLRLTRFLEDRLSTTEGKSLLLQREENRVQTLLREFYSSADTGGALLSEQKQRQVFDEVAARIAHSQARERDVANEKQSGGSRANHRLQSRDHSTGSVRKASPRQQRSALDRNRHRSRSRSSRRRSHSDSRSHSRERTSRYRRRSHSGSRSQSRERTSGQRRRRSPTRSRSRVRSRRKASNRRRHYSSSLSRSRSRER
ncbi:unnamed protein product [Hyaloperonospora brassicae]|uniref:WW domain-containing protein n=1 Tax=Hyaloperonospora brassicae TaxID=162125 RepID=A0AAV0TVP3_HYABA|nr:unnamed protein product [Hyaloperonospora brassicae]